jgi:hypothetical protein
MHPSWVVEDAIVRGVRGSRRRPARQVRPRPNASATAVSPRARAVRGAVAAMAVIVAAIVGGCASGHHNAAPPVPAAVAIPAATPTPTPAPLTCSTTVTHTHPADGRKVGISVSTAPGARITVVARFLGGNRKKTARADSTGLRTFWFQVGNATPGYRVKVDVRVSAHGHRRSCRASFTPRQPPPPPVPTPAPTTAAGAPAPKHHSGAWCTATASVYNAAKDWNNVYVHSNQPYTDARASADGDSWSYETNGSGYALIYLNGPPPGALITVTVGGATCTTSD